MSKPNIKSGDRSKQKATNQAKEKSNEHNEIIAAINRVAHELHTANDENTPKEKGKKCREIATILALIAATIIAIIALVVTSRDTQKSIFSANRAWLSPIAAHIDGLAPSTERPFGYFVNYGNVGGGAATEFVAQEEIGTVENPRGKSWYIPFEKRPLKDICAITTAAKSGGAVYHSGPQDYTYSKSDSSFKITPEILNGSDIIFAHGCFAYRTFGEERKSEYCFLFVPTPNPAIFTAVHCPIGNGAY